MKRIFLLSILLLGLGFFTYQFEEVGGQKRLAQQEKDHQMIDEAFLGELKAIQGPNFSIKKDGEFFKTSDGTLVDGARLQKYLDILGKMKVRRYLEKDETNPLFFTDDAPVLQFNFANGYVYFKLGEKLRFDQSFYMEVNQNGVVKQMVAFDSSPNEGTYDKTTFHKNPEKYLRFKTMILLKEDFFIDTHLFQKEFMNKKVDWVSLKVKSNQKNEFRLDVPKRETYPAPPSGMKTKRKAFQSFISDLVNFSGTGWLGSGLLEAEVASIEFKSKDGNVNNLKIYRMFDGKPGHYAHLVESGKTLAFSPKAMDLFIKDGQEFWDLRAIVKNEPNELVMTFPEGKEVPVEFEYGKVFRALSLDKLAGEAVNTAFKSLIDLFSKEADYMSTVEADEDLDKSLFQVNWGSDDRSFHVILNGAELILANKTLGYKLHYNLGDFSSLGKELKDFFIKK